ncbi:hypothetical protein EGW08_023561 [Elysia chlorotica]|uniref:Amine oxidase n=1 Tax=Elysia chlorotica TaxID=188477 RepID=A0A3S1AVV0_ELYCH|nr:hypothetical protein EGW08_023561 [Elysia chlorotica]
MTSFTNKPGRAWQVSTGILLVVCIGLLIALIVVASEDKTTTKLVTVTSDGQEVAECGESNPNGNSIDLREPSSPGPFHDLTEEEMKKLRTFLQNDPRIRANTFEEIATLNTKSSYAYMVDLWVPPKSEVLDFLDSGGPQPARQARVMMFRGDKSPPVVEEWICGPLPDVTNCDLMNFTNRRNPVEFESRTILVVGNYDYVIDFIFHQNGVIETRLMSTGYIQGNVFRAVERQYGFRLEETLTANLHHHMFHLKVDLDVSGTSNRYETLNVEPMATKICWVR